MALTGGPPVCEATWLDGARARVPVAEPAALAAALLRAELPRAAPFRVVAARPLELSLVFDDAQRAQLFAAALRAEHAPVVGTAETATLRLGCHEWFGANDAETVALQVVKVTYHLIADTGGE